MSRGKVFDSSALLAYFGGEPGGRKVMGILKEAAENQEDLLLSVIHWGEILYVIEGRHGLERKNEIERLLSQMQFNLVSVDQDLVREAAHLKAVYGLPYVDCFAASLAIVRHFDLVTGDYDFKPLEKRIKIIWV